MPHLDWAYLTVGDLCENIQGFLHAGLVLGGQDAVVLQDAQLNVSAGGLRLQLFQELLRRSHRKLLRLLLLRRVPERRERPPGEVRPPGKEGPNEAQTEAASESRA